MAKQAPHITPAELEIMKVLWKLGSGTVQQTLDGLVEEGQEPLAYTTVMTMLKNLAEKDVLRVDRNRQPFVYTPKVRRDQVLSQRLTHFLDSVFDGEAADLVLHLVEGADLSAEDLRRIEEKIQKREADDD